MIHGTPKLHIVDDQTDRIGIRTVIMSLVWQPTGGDLSPADVLRQTPPTPDAPAGTFFIGRQTLQQNGGMKTLWTWEGFDGDPKSVAVKTRGRSTDWAFNPGFAEVSVARHPRIEKLLEMYNGQPIDGEIIWPRKIKKGGSGAFGSSALGSSGSGLSGAGSGKEEQSPLFGQTSYFTLAGGTYTYRYLAFDESQVPETGGKLFSSAGLPGRPPRYTNRNWLGLGAILTRRGPVVEAQEQYWLSDEGGWPKPLYQTGSNEAGGNGSQGVKNLLNIGGLQSGATTTTS